MEIQRGSQDDEGSEKAHEEAKCPFTLDAWQAGRCLCKSQSWLRLGELELHRERWFALPFNTHAIRPIAESYRRLQNTCGKIMPMQTVDQVAISIPRFQVYTGALQVAQSQHVNVPWSLTVSTKHEGFLFCRLPNPLQDHTSRENVSHSSSCSGTDWSKIFSLISSLLNRVLYFLCQARQCSQMSKAIFGPISTFQGLHDTSTSLLKGPKGNSTLSYNPWHFWNIASSYWANKPCEDQRVLRGMFPVAGMHWQGVRWMLSSCKGMWRLMGKWGQTAHTQQDTWMSFRLRRLMNISDLCMMPRVALSHTASQRWSLVPYIQILWLLSSEITQD